MKKLYFLEQFVPKILYGIKTSTIRFDEQSRFFEYEDFVAHLGSNKDDKGAFAILECININEFAISLSSQQEMDIATNGILYSIDSKLLWQHELENLYKQEGFESLLQMNSWFKSYLKNNPKELIKGFMYTFKLVEKL